MPITRRTRLSLIAAAASGALVVTMAGTALASDHVARPNCSDLDLQDAQAALDTVAPAERIRLENLCELTPIVRSDDAEDDDARDDDAAPATTPAAAPEEESADTAGADDGADDEDADDEKGDKKDSADDDGDSDGEDGNGKDGNDAAGGDRDCADFDSQADAQAAFEESSNDEERLDADDDGIACENHFGTEGQQVAVHPKGGVATGGAALP